MLNIALFGPPGAGKGTQAKKLIEKYDLVYISTGDMLRQEITEKTEIGLKAKDIIEKGGLADDELIVQLIEKKIIDNPKVTGFLFDGFPRTYVQAYILEGLLLKMNRSLTCMLSLEVPNKELISRLLERAKTSGRKDDKLKVIEYRLKEYKEKTIPVIAYYKEKDIYIPVNGIGSINEVENRLAKGIEHTLKKALLNVVLFGYPGAGKGTQAMMLAKKYNLKYISTGKLLRDEIANNTEFGKIALPYMEKGAIVPDEIVIRLVENEIKTHPEANGFIFKGFPRTMVQAYIIEGLLRKINSSISCIIDVSATTLECIKRLSARSKTPEKRSYDANVDTIIKRIEEYEDRTLPVDEYYQNQNKVIKVNGMGTADEVYKRLSKVIKEAFTRVR